MDNKRRGPPFAAGETWVLYLEDDPELAKQVREIELRYREGIDKLDQEYDARKKELIQMKVHDHNDAIQEALLRKHIKGT